MEYSCLASTRKGLVVLSLLVFCCCYCKENDLKNKENKERFCSKDSEGEVEICNVGEEDKYSQESNTKNKAGLDSLSIQLKLKELGLNNSSKLESLGIQPIEPINEWKAVEIPFVQAVKVGHVQDVEVTPGVIRQMKTLSVYPPIFEIPDFLDPLECDFIMAMAERKGMTSNKKLTYNEGITFEDPENTFKSWDSNQNDFIDLEEILLLPGKIDLKFSEDDVLQMFKDLEMDKDENGKIDLEEFKNTDLLKIKEYINERLKDMGQRRNATSAQAWLWHDEDELLRYQPELLHRFHQRLEAVTKIPKEILKESEPLQVLKYDKGSYHYCQQDSEPNVGTIPCCQYGDTKQCRLCRFISMSYFLNDVEEGGELIFPLANSKFEEDIMLTSGIWTGFFTFAKTTGSRNKFNVQLTFKTEGANKVLQGNGTDESGAFELVDSLVVNDIVRFRKRYTDKSEKDVIVKYAGRIKSGATIEGKWWVPGHQKMNGNFFMYYSDYERWMDRELQKCDSSAYCPQANLVIKPKKGTAIMWYNHKINEDRWVGVLDEKSYYGNCDVIKGEKWVATNWINVIGDGNTTMKAWKAGKNWLSVMNREKNEEFVLNMYKNETKKEEDIIEQMFNKDMKEKGINPVNSQPPVRHVLNAVTSLLEVLEYKDVAEVSKKVHQKLQMTCIPLVFNEEGKIRVVDGSKAD